MQLCIDTCVLPRCRLEEGRIYRDRFGISLGFELLPMFDLPDFEENLRRNIPLLEEGYLMFHEPVWGVEHSAPKGSTAYEEGMYHIRLTQKYAEILHPGKMVYHLSNGIIPPGKRDGMLRTSLENLEEMRELFPDVEILVENTGIRGDGTLLLDQDEFTGLCLDRHLPVLVDIGHAHANGWDLGKLIRNLKEQIGGFHLHNNNGRFDQHNRLRDGTMDFTRIAAAMNREAPEAPRVIEYTRTEYHGEPLAEDILYLQGLSTGLTGNRPNEKSAREDQPC